ncbi:MAG: hypothetical protein RLZZ297_1015 [Chloroflexota bacterium]|jgi:hypothetical protein
MEQSTVYRAAALSGYQEWLAHRQHALEGAYGLSQCEWVLSQDDHVVRYEHRGVVRALATYRIIGSYSAANGLWLWSWANPAIDRAVGIERALCQRWAHDTGLTELGAPAFAVSDCPELWHDVAAAWDYQQVKQTSIARIASMVTYAIDGQGVLYYTNPQHELIGCAVLTRVYAPVRSC